MNALVQFPMLLVAIVLLSTWASNGVAQTPAGNATHKHRVQPDRMAIRAGSAVSWLKDFESARLTSQQTGKPIFWYIPTINGTFMDRKPVIDRYMMAGLFSYPEFVELLNQKFVPLKTVPAPEQQRAFDLRVYRFIEPGLLVLDSEGQLLTKIDRITTQHPLWFVHIFEQLLPAVDFDDVKRRFADRPGEPDPLETEATPSVVQPATITDRAYRALFTGMAQFRAGRHERAKETWRAMAQWAPHHPLTWKAAAEAQGLGPFVRGFEVFGPLPDACLQAGVRSSGSAAPQGAYNENQLWDRGVRFLLGMQNEQGGFVDSDYDFGGTDSLPNVHVAVTSLVGMALLEAQQRMASIPGGELERAIDGCFHYVRNERNLNRVDRDEILWADAYRLRFLCRYAAQRRRNINEDIQAATTALENLQSKRGNWYHEYQNPFVTATALLALKEAHSSGARVDAGRVERGLRALKNDRSPDGSFSYFSTSNRVADSPQAVPAAAGRMPVCELALWRWGQSDQARLLKAVRHGVEFHHLLQSALKYDNHTSNMGYGGFFFWYDMRGRTEVMASIEDREIRRALLARQKDLVISLPEIDGCFVDSHELGRCYGTAMALMCLAMCDSTGAPFER